MADTLRSRTIRLAHSFPAQSAERRSLLAALASEKIALMSWQQDLLSDVALYRVRKWLPEEALSELREAIEKGPKRHAEEVHDRLLKQHHRASSLTAFDKEGEFFHQPGGGPPVDVEQAIRAVYGVVGKMKAEAKRQDDLRLDYWADEVSKAMLKIWRKR